MVSRKKYWNFLSFLPAISSTSSLHEEPQFLSILELARSILIASNSAPRGSLLNGLPCLRPSVSSSFACIRRSPDAEARIPSRFWSSVQRLHCFVVTFGARPHCSPPLRSTMFPLSPTRGLETFQESHLSSNSRVWNGGHQPEHSLVSPFFITSSCLSLPVSTLSLPRQLLILWKASLSTAVPRPSTFCL